VIHLGAAADELDHAAEKVTGIGSRMLGAIAERFASFIIALADFIAPAPPPTKDQAERMQRAAGEADQARADTLHQQEKSERLRATLEQIARDDAQRDLSLARTLPSFEHKPLI
jgi:hypothetical protein